MKSVQNFKIVSNMKAYFSDDIQCLQKRVDAPDTSQDSISSDQMLLPDLKSIILNQSDLIREDYNGLRLTESHSRSRTTNSSSNLFIFEEQFASIDSISSDLISDEF
ncbi:unnamed protein product (macronuclear) [Paramecium tetraurelia]|uniref:Uncharacterized protein n=1 Tax=Paramecium tetraurelia TaxID=5888 RepID=A0E409_PARTE|nr:uncharacterized protein GSPATT00023199001 [Paramecium tetraurelia]CAK90026.1 unnamed protein product [Paramecium tetraurelia]|eukprot:XP_001457423.1 hypothetical protein (macronuclear) [Paramecium tetraurelia strain d4-2]